MPDKKTGERLRGKARPRSNRQHLNTCVANFFAMEVDVRDRGVFLEAPCESLKDNWAQGQAGSVCLSVCVALALYLSLSLIYAVYASC